MSKARCAFTASCSVWSRDRDLRWLFPERGYTPAGEVFDGCLLGGDLRPGVIDHIAFSGDDPAGTLAALKAHNVEHTCRRQVDSGVWQVFFFDPNGAKVEVDFASVEQPGA